MSYLLALISSLIINNSESDLSKTCLNDCSVSDTGLALIRTYEGYSPFIYICPAGKPTIGYGHVVTKDSKVKEPLMQKEAEDLLRKDLEKFSGYINKLTKSEFNQNQSDAIHSFVYNLGPTNYKNSTLLRKINERRHEEVPTQLKRWNKAAGKVLAGLERRREAEAKLYTKNY